MKFRFAILAGRLRPGRPGRRHTSGTCPPPTPRQLPQRKPEQFAKDVDRLSGGKLRSPSTQRGAVQGSRDQARGAGRPGADRRAPAGQLPERMRSSARRSPLPADSYDDAAKCGVAEAAGRQEARRTGDDVLYAVAWPPKASTPSAPQFGRRQEGPEVAAYSLPPPASPSGGRAAGHGAGRGAFAGHGHGRGRFVHVLRLDRLRHQDVRAHQELVRHPGLDAQNAIIVNRASFTHWTSPRRIAW